MTIIHQSNFNSGSLSPFGTYLKQRTVTHPANGAYVPPTGTPLTPLPAGTGATVTLVSTDRGISARCFIKADPDATYLEQRAAVSISKAVTGPFTYYARAYYKFISTLPPDTDYNTAKVDASLQPNSSEWNWVGLISFGGFGGFRLQQNENGTTVWWEFMFVKNLNGGNSFTNIQLPASPTKPASIMGDGQWHWIEVGVVRAAVGGGMVAWVDGVEVGRSLTSDTLNVTGQDLYNISFGNVGASFSYKDLEILVDEAVIADAPIGPLPTLIPTSMVWTKPPTGVVAGQPFDVEVNLTSSQLMVSTPIDFYVDGLLAGTRWTSAYNITTNKAALTITIPTSGTHEVAAAFSGTTVYQGSEIATNVVVQGLTYTVEVIPPNPSNACTMQTGTSPAGYPYVGLGSTPLPTGTTVAIKANPALDFTFLRWDYWIDGVLTSNTFPNPIPNFMSGTANRKFTFQPVFTPAAPKRIITFTSTPIPVTATIGGLTVPSGQAVQVDDGTTLNVTVPYEVNP